MLYLDHNATTPLDVRVREAMAPYLERFHGNPSALYRLGRISRDAVEQAREQVAALVGAAPAQIIFTSGGTEADNLALVGMWPALAGRGVAVGATEHPAVVEPAHHLQRHAGTPLTVLPVDSLGRMDQAALDGLSSVHVGLVSLMWANNETGVVHDLPRFAQSLREKGIWVHSDAVQAVGKVRVDFAASGLHLMSVSSHKINGPKGAGALVMDRSVPLTPLLHGGGQEKGLRSGTENVPAIVGFGKAAELAREENCIRAERAFGLRRALEAALADLSDAVLFARDAERLPNTLQFGMAGIDGEALVMALDRQRVAVSSGSACASGAGEPSPVLLAMGYAPEVARTAVRVSFGAGNEMGDVERFVAALKTAVATLT